MTIGTVNINGVERPAVDGECYDLAEHFLAGVPYDADHCWALAGAIQQAVEDWFELPRERPCTCHPDDKPPVPCARKYALQECKAAASRRDSSQ